MIESFKYEKRNQYPHIKPRDKEIWDRFIEKYPNEYDEVIYDLPVGASAPISKDTDPATAKSFTILTQKKIDVIGIKGNKKDLIELKPDASGSTIGQVISYVELYKNYVDPDATIYPVIVTDRASQDLPMLCISFGVRLVVV